MDSLISAAARALSVGDPLGALKRVALRDDAPALALRGIAEGLSDPSWTWLSDAVTSYLDLVAASL